MRLDVFAHLASGALLGRAVRPTGAQWKGVALFAAAAGLSPDIDAPIAFWGAEAWAQWHQLFTHSLLGLLVIPALCSVLPFRFASWKKRYALALGGWGLHVALDGVSRWPVPIAWPLSSQRWALFLTTSDFVLSIDMILVLGLAASLWEPAMRYARSIAIVTYLAMFTWIAAGLP